MRLLVVDDEQVALTSVKRLLKRNGFKDVEICAHGKDAVARIKEGDFDIVLLDLLMPEVDGLAVLKATKPYNPDTEFIILTAMDDVSSAVKAIRLGAYDYLVKPVDNERLILSIERAYERRGLLAGLAGSRTGSGGAEIPEAFSDTLTRSPRMKQLLSYAQVMAGSGNPVLITGESGTGKELLAGGIHRAGPSSNGPFIAVNVSSIPETLFESHLFGHIKGAFTGADKDYPGLFEQADGGTLFLDEIGELPLNLQAKLLRVLEEKFVVRLGETRPIPVAVRIVSATNKDLDKACQKGEFRLDLMYRLKSAHIRLPPLREREEDIPLIAYHFLKKASVHYGKDVADFSPEAIDVLARREFRGNIRELAQLVENAVLFAESSVILPRHLREEGPCIPSLGRRLQSLKENDETHVAYVLTHSKGDRKETARILGITVRQLQRKLARMKKNPRWKSILGDI